MSDEMTKVVVRNELVGVMTQAEAWAFLMGWNMARGRKVRADQYPPPPHMNFDSEYKSLGRVGE